MRLTIVLLGHTLDLTLEATADEEAAANSLDGGLTASTPVGYAPPYGNQRWQQGDDHGAGEPEDRR